MTVYARTWWGKKWLQSFDGIDYDNRLPRGRTCANTGRAFGIKINDHMVTAKVHSSAYKIRTHPYKVEIILNELSLSEQQIIRQIIETSPAILAKLINRQLSASLFDKLNDLGIKLFPSNWQEMNASSNCPDWAMPCKHIAGSLISSALDYSISVAKEVGKRGEVDRAPVNSGIICSKKEVSNIPRDPITTNLLEQLGRNLDRLKAQNPIPRTFIGKPVVSRVIDTLHKVARSQAVG